MIDTLIIGGGLAGSAAALWLADRGHTSTILEARSRLGGRAHSRDWGNSGGPVEYGGGWVRSDHVEMQGLCHRLGIGLTPRAKVIGHSHFRDGVWQADPAEDMAEYAAGLSQVLTDAAETGSDSAMARLIQGMTLQQYLDHRALPPSVRRAVLALWTITGSGAPDRIGVTELLTPKLAKGFGVKLEELAFTVTGGVSCVALAAATASRAQVCLGDAVERLEDCGDHVRATLGSGRAVEAQTALVALPLAALGQIRFAPPLRPAQHRLRAIGHDGAALKLLIRAKGPKPGHLATGETLGFRWIYADHILPDGNTLLVAFALQAEVGEPDHATVAAVLAAAFPTAELVDFDWHDWKADPFARGTWVSPRLATWPDYAAEHWGPLGRFAFAGSDLYSAEQGWFEGALLTARAAVAALDLCLKQNG